MLHPVLINNPNSFSVVEDEGDNGLGAEEDREQKERDKESDQC